MALDLETRAQLLAVLGEALQRAGYVPAAGPAAPATQPAATPAAPPASYKEALSRAQECLRRRDWDSALAAARFAAERAPDCAPCSPAPGCGATTCRSLSL